MILHQIYCRSVQSLKIASLLLIIVLTGCNSSPELSIAADPHVSVFPNPVTDVAYIQVQNANGSSVNVFDSEGNSIFSSTVSSDQTYNVNMQNRKSGTFYVVVKSQTVNSTVKFIKL